jgi:flagellar protein FliT
VRTAWRGADALTSWGQLAATTARMVELARARHWQLLPALDAQCASLVDELRTTEVEDLTAAERARTVALARRIGEDQQELRTLMQPQFMALVRRMDESARAQAK